jgi:hypothetical protein
MTFTGQEYGGAPYKFKTKGGDGQSTDAWPIHEAMRDDILSEFVNDTVTTILIPAVTGKKIEVINIDCTASAPVVLRLEDWDTVTPIAISPDFHVTADKDFSKNGSIGSAIAKSTVSQSIRIALVSGTGNFTAWVQYRLI